MFRQITKKQEIPLSVMTVRNYYNAFTSKFLLQLVFLIYHKVYWLQFYDIYNLLLEKSKSLIINKTKKMSIFTIFTSYFKKN